MSWASKLYKFLASNTNISFYIEIKNSFLKLFIHSEKKIIWIIHTAPAYLRISYIHIIIQIKWFFFYFFYLNSTSVTKILYYIIKFLFHFILIKKKLIFFRIVSFLEVKNLVSCQLYINKLLHFLDVTSFTLLVVYCVPTYL